MNIKIHEESRTLQEFYPDPVKRSQVHYGFAHRFLPQYVHQNPYAFFSYLFRRDLPGSPSDPIRFIQSRWTMFEERAGLIPRADNPLRDGLVFRRVSDLAMSIGEEAGRPVALVQMPAPEQPVQAFFVAAVLLVLATPPESWPREAQARVFTLEAYASEHPGAGQTGLMCEWTKAGSHRNFGVIVQVERGAFLRVVGAALQAPAAAQT